MAFTLRTDDELERALDDLAELEGMSRQEVVRRAVLEKRERLAGNADVDRLAAETTERWSSLLDRLADA